MLAALGLFPLLLISAFWITAPWTIAGRLIDRLTPILGAALLLFLLPAWSIPSTRVLLLQRLLVGRVRVSARALILGCVLLTVFLFRFLLSRFYALEINAWDFSMFDLALEQGTAGPLYSIFFGQSYLAVHASYVLFLLVPLYWLWRSPYWLLGAQGLALVAATGIGFLAVRRILKDDLAAVLVALGFFLNSYTAKIAQYAFHVEVFYPLTLLLAALGFLRRSWPLFTLGLVLSVAVKEDAVLALFGLAALAVIAGRGWLWAAAAILIGGVGFAIAHFVVMPHFAESAPGDPWYSAFWSSYGPTPLKAAAAMITQPLKVGMDVAESGLRDVLEPLLFLPLVGWEWLLAAAPPSLVYATAQGEQLSRFNLYYSAPFLGFLVLGAALGLTRIAKRVRRRDGILPTRRSLRIGATLLLLACAFDGPSYRFAEAKPQRQDIRKMVQLVPAGVFLRVQGSLLPHAGYSTTQAPLASIDPFPRGCALLIDPGSNPYPFSEKAIATLVSRLTRESGYSVTVSEHGLVLAVPLKSAGLRPGG